jgi:hypothetical protein
MLTHSSRPLFVSFVPARRGYAILFDLFLLSIYSISHSSLTSLSISSNNARLFLCILYHTFLLSIELWLTSELPLSTIGGICQWLLLNFTWSCKSMGIFEYGYRWTAYSRNSSSIAPQPACWTQWLHSPHFLPVLGCSWDPLCPYLLIHPLLTITYF